MSRPALRSLCVSQICYVQYVMVFKYSNVTGFCPVFPAWLQSQDEIS